MNKKRFFMIFGIAFAAAAVVAVILLLVAFRGMFYNTYIKKGNEMFERGNYEKALKLYDTALGWKSSDATVYLKMAQTHIALDDYDTAAEILDDAIEKKVSGKNTGLEELHTTRIRIYTSTGRFVEAANYIATIDDQYIRKKIESARPNEPIYTPAPQKYENALKMVFTVQPGETIYYTTDGKEPTNTSSIYTTPINIPLGETTVQAIAVDANGLVSPKITATYIVDNAQEEVVFDDPKMEQMVRNALDTPYGTIRVKDLENVTELTNNDCNGLLTTLSDIELMPNLEELYLENETELDSISQISGRTKLKSLALVGCALGSDDINALSGLTELESLDLSDNSLTSVSALSGLKKLRYLFISKNNISDIYPLESLESVILVNASENNISEIPSFSLSLESLYLSKNRIEDVSSLSTLRRLMILDLSYNSITKADSIERLEALEILTLSNNPDLSDFSFMSSLPALVSVDVSDTKFSTAKPLAKSTVVTFSADNTRLSSVSDLAKITALTSVSIANTPVKDIEPLAAVPALDYLDVSGCKIGDYTVLEDFEGLYTLRAIGADSEQFELIEFANDDIYVVTEE